MVGYGEAALLGTWNLTCQQETLGASINTLTARVKSINQYLAAQRPFRIGLWMGASWWVWTDILVEGDPEVGEITIRVKGNPVAQLSV